MVLSECLKILDLLMEDLHDHERIKAFCRQRMIESHPDHGGHNGAFILIKDACDTVMKHVWQMKACKDNSQKEYLADMIYLPIPSHVIYGRKKIAMATNRGDKECR